MLTKKILKHLMEKTLQLLMKMKRKIFLKLHKQRQVLQLQIKLNRMHRNLKERLRS